MKLIYLIQPDSFCQYYRKLSINNIDWQMLNNIAYIYCNIEYGNYNEKTKLFETLGLIMYPNYKVILQISNSTLVNPANGNQVIDGELAENCTMGEYDFFIDMMNSDVHFSTILENGINRIILRGRHNI
jgi:hypothetical protein